MTLGTKITLVITIVILIFMGLVTLLQYTIISPQFEVMEKRDASEDLRRATEALQREIYHLDLACFDWASWDDTYEYVVNGNSEYVESNLIDETFTDNAFNLIYILDAHGRVVWGRIMDLQNGDPIVIPEFPSDTFIKTHPLLGQGDSKKTVSGILTTQAGPMLVSSRPILTSDNQGPVRGRFIIGRLVNRTMIHLLGEQTRVNLGLWPAEKEGVPEDVVEVMLNLVNKHRPQQIVISRGIVRAFTVLNDIDGSPAILVEARVGREITRKGRLALQFTLASVLLAGLLMVIAIRLSLYRLILARFNTLSSAVERVERKSDTSIRVPVEGQDELTQLCRQVNGMLESLQKAEQRIVRSEANYREAIESASGVPYRLNFRTSHYEFVGAGIERLLEVPADKFSPDRMREVVIEVHGIESHLKESVQESCRKFHRGEIPVFQIDYHVRVASGLEKWISDSAVPMRDEQTGEIIGCLGILQDITARKMAQEELRRQSDFVDTILQTLDVLVVVLDKEGRIQLINQACEQLTGQTVEAVKGKYLWDLFVFGDDAELERRAQQKLLGGQSPIDYELVWRIQDGTERLLSLSGSVVYNSAGKIEYLIETGLDVTSHRALEREVLEISEREQQRMGQDLHDGLCQQLGGMGFLSDALAGTLESEGSVHSTQIKKIAEGLRDSLRKARSLAEGAYPVSLEREGLLTALQEYTASVQDMYGTPCNLSCEGNIPELPTTTAIHLYRIAQESISNAARHANPTQIKVILALWDERVCLTVTDNGQGFDQQDDSTGGMGRSIMKYRAKLIGATLNIESRVGKGTTVTCTLKRKSEVKD